jgi:hypothetical protein
MTETSTIKWIKDNLGIIMGQAILQSPGGSNYTPAWLGGMAYRETGFLVMKHTDKPVNEVSALMIGDQGHGRGFWQIDDRAFPDFCKSGDWKDPLKCCVKAISVLEGNRKYFTAHYPELTGTDLQRAIIASYNCGCGNVSKALSTKHDVDYFTFNQDYSKEVLRFMGIYSSLPNSNNP